MQILHHCNHEPALATRIEKAYSGNIDNKMKRRRRSVMKVGFIGAGHSDAETLEFFAELLGRFSKTREDVKTWFEVGELDDYVRFGGKA
jgi:hypothetical protein